MKERSRAGSDRVVARSAALREPGGLPSVELAGSAAQEGAHLDHRDPAGMHGLDDLRVVDALEIDRGDAEIAMSELALDNDQRNAFAGHLDGVGVPELVRGEAPPHAGSGGSPAQIGSRGRVGPVPSARGSGDDAEQGSDWEFEACVEPWLVLLGPGVHADFAAPSSLALAHQQRPAPLVEVGFAQRERFLDV